MEVIYYPKEKNCYANKDIVSWARANNLDYICEIHRNAGGGYGYETLVKGGADSTDKAIHNAIVGLGFRDRGIKLRTDLYNMNAINGKVSYSLIEVGFIDSVDDNNLFDRNLDAIGKAIYSACESQGVKRLGIICGHGQGDSGASAFGRREDLDVRKINVTQPVVIQPKEVQDFDKADLFVKGHVQDIGWDSKYKISGDLIGTEGQSLRLEALKIKLGDVLKGNGSLLVTLHIQDVGDKVYNISDEEEIGTVGQGKRIEAISMEFTGQLADLYDIAYKVHIAYQGDTEYVKNGKLVGTKGQSLRIESLQYAVIKK